MRDMKQGEVIEAEDFTFKRPGTNIRPDEEKYVIGRKLNKNMKQDDLLDWDDLI